MYYGGTSHVCVPSADLSFELKIQIQCTQHTLRITALTVWAYNEFPETLHINLLINLLSKLILKYGFFKKIDTLGLNL